MDGGQDNGAPNKGRSIFEKIFSGSDVRPHLHLWLHNPVMLDVIQRWGELRQKVTGLPKQSALSHSYSLTVLTDSVAGKLNRETFLDLDRALLMRAALFHDVPEGILKRDVSFRVKTSKDDLNEYLAFANLIAPMSQAAQAECMEAFLLQFAHEMPDGFPDEALRVMRDLKRRYPSEVILFPFMERYDYLKMGLAHLQETNDPTLLAHLLRNHWDELDGFVEQLPQLAKIWSPGFKRRCQMVVDLNPPKILFGD